MRVLFVSNTFPEDRRASVYGIFNRLHVLLDAVRSIADEVDMLLYAPPAQMASQPKEELEAKISEFFGPKVRARVAARATPKQQPSFFDAYLSGLFDFTRLSDVYHGYYQTTGPAQMAAFSDGLDRKPDWIFAHRLSAMAPLLLTERGLPPVILDLDDIEHRAFLSALRVQPFWPGKLLCYPHALSIRRGGCCAVRKARLTFVCSPEDRDYLNRIAGTESVVALQNSVTMPETIAEVPAELSVAFIGSYSYAPNIDAADYLIRSIWPLIRQKVPDASLFIVGAKPEMIPSYGSSHDGVTFTGFAEDMNQLYRHVRVIACPIRSGGGTRIKIIEAAAYGKAVVATPFSAGGLDLRDGEELLLRREPAAFADACASLLLNRENCRKLGLAARRRVERFYDRAAAVTLAKDQIVRALPELYRCRTQ